MRGSSGLGSFNNEQIDSKILLIVRAGLHLSLKYQGIYFHWNRYWDDKLLLKNLFWEV